MAPAVALGLGLGLGLGLLLLLLLLVVGMVGVAVPLGGMMVLEVPLGPERVAVACGMSGGPITH